MHKHIEQLSVIESQVVRFLPEHPDGSQPPIYFAGGVGYGPGSGKTEPVMRAIAGHGREAWTLDKAAPKDIDHRYEITKDGQIGVGNRADAWRALGDQATSRIVALDQVAAAEDLITAMDQAGIKRTDAIFQSADALNGLIAASRRPELFNNIVFAFPGGQVRRPRPGRNMSASFQESVADRLSGHPRKQPVPIELPTQGESNGDKRSRFMRYAGQSAMGLAATHSYQGDMLTELRRKEIRPGVAMVVGLRDWMIRYDDVFDSLGSADNVDYIRIVDSGHGIKGDQDTLNDILELLPMLEEHKKDATGRPLRERLILPEHISPARAEMIRAMADRVPQIDG